MHKSSWLVLFIVLFSFALSQAPVSNDRAALVSAYKKAAAQYHLADKTAEAAADDETDKLDAADQLNREALQSFEALRPQLRSLQLDSLYFHSTVYTGLIYHYFDSLPAAKAAYIEAISLKEKVPHMADSFLFQPLLFTGAICYRSGEFDSAFYYLKKAEAVTDLYSETLGEEQRLYNMLGVMNYETGNLEMSKHYVEKAIEHLTRHKDYDTALLNNFQLNIASILIRLEKYDEAGKVLQNAAGLNFYPDQVNHKLGYVALRSGHYLQALKFFNRVKYSNNKTIIELLLNKSEAFQKMQEADSAAFYLLSAKTENFRWNGSRKSISHGLILKQEAESLTQKKQYQAALPVYQQAIIQFSNTFDDTAVMANPQSFSGTFAYIDLFNVLIDKAGVFNMLYKDIHDISYLEAALATYRSAFNLAAYVERTYSSDEARLFLGKIKHNTHSRPIDVSLELYDLTLKKEYLEEAYRFDQQNKASILALNVQTGELKNKSGTSGELLQKEASLKALITRLTLKAAVTADSALLRNLYSQIRDKEIELDRLQPAINSLIGLQNMHITGYIPPVKELQQQLDPFTALLSYHLSENELITLVISANRFEYLKLPLSQPFFADIDSLKNALHSTAGGRYTGSTPALRLYNQLIQPALGLLQQKKRLIIIPDDELHYLPFEALQNGNNKFLVEMFAVQYQFATALVMQPKEEVNNTGLLAFAPFASAGYNNESENFAPLPASLQEVSQLKGTLLTDKQAGKQQFLQQANRYGIIHLATHASMDNTDPMRSFIAFYPGENDHKLYAREIYDLSLDSVQLIILSACETGNGQLIKGEGLMSLSRVFTYAGCPNIITSLWKAEDKTTAFITERLHHYLGRKYTRDQALQQAKLDLLRNEDINPAYKSPRYWAHLVYVGNYQPDVPSKNWWWLAITIISGAILYRLVPIRKRKDRPR